MKPILNKWDWILVITGILFFIVGRLTIGNKVSDIFFMISIGILIVFLIITYLKEKHHG